MSKHMPVPPELEHLIEKRDQETDRREDKRRGQLELQGDAGAEAKKPERRQNPNRRQKRRRKTDS